MKIFINFLTISEDGIIVGARDFIESKLQQDAQQSEAEGNQRRQRATLNIPRNDSTITLTYDSDNNILWKLVIDYGNRVDLQTEDILDAVINAIMKVSELGGGRVRFSFHSDTYPLGCHVFTQRPNQAEETLLRILNDNLQFVVKYATEVRANYVNPTLTFGSQTARFRALNAFHVFTRIWDVVGTVLQKRVKYLDVYDTEFKDAIDKILSVKDATGTYTIAELKEIVRKVKVDDGAKAVTGFAEKILNISLKLSAISNLISIYSRLFGDGVAELKALLKSETREITDRFIEDLENKLKSDIRSFLKEKGIKEVIKKEAVDFISRYFSIGGDPELMGYKSERDRVPTRAFNILNFSEPTTYYNRINIGSIGTDGYSALYEFRPSASRDPITLFGKFLKLLSDAAVGSSGRISQYIAVWNSNCQNYPLGGHIHIGSFDDRFAGYISGRLNSIREEMDRTYGLGQVFYNLSTDARRDSGYASSSCESKRWGGEYRTPPARVWSEPKLFMLTTTILFLISFREYLRWKGHELADIIEKVVTAMIRSLVVKLKVQASSKFNNKLYYVNDERLKKKFLRRVSAAIGIKVDTVDDLITKGDKMFVYYISKLIDSVDVENMNL